MITIIGKKWGNIGGFRLVVIGSKLSERKPEGLIILLVKHIGSEILFQNWINMFCLAICFWVECGGES
jgi:hypothetical protein